MVALIFIAAIVIIIIVALQVYSKNKKKEKEEIDYKEKLRLENIDKVRSELNFKFNNLPEPSLTNIPNYLFVDVETTGLPKNRNGKIEDLKNWPGIVQIAWILTDIDGKLIRANDFIIKQKKEVPIKAFEVHGISKADSIQHGVDSIEAMTVFSKDFTEANIIISHNIDFDYAIVVAEMLRNKIDVQYQMKSTICTMKRGTNYCKIYKERGDGYKYPNLEELTKHVFLPNHIGYFSLGNLHDARIDVRIAMVNFFKMKELNIIKEEFPFDFQLNNY